MEVYLQHIIIANFDMRVRRQYIPQNRNQSAVDLYSSHRTRSHGQPFSKCSDTRTNLGRPQSQLILLRPLFYQGYSGRSESSVPDFFERKTVALNNFFGPYWR